MDGGCAPIDDCSRYPDIKDLVDGLANREPQVIALANLNGFVSARVQRVCQEHVDLLTHSSKPLPAIIVHRPSMKVVDGIHRYEAARVLGSTSIAVVYFDGTEQEAFALSVHLNTTHGLPLAAHDRKAAALRMINECPLWSDRFVAELTGLSHKTVAAIRRSTGADPQSNGRLGRDGRVRPGDSAARRRRAGQVLAANPSISLRALAAEAGISVSTARDVRLRVSDGLDPVPDRQRSTAGSSGRSSVTSPQVSHMPSRSVSGASAKPINSGSRSNDKGTLPDRRDVEDALSRLSRDPSMRFSDTGRTLLRHLANAAGAIDQCESLIDALPAHCTGTVARIARCNAERWQRLVDAVLDDSKVIPPERKTS